MIAVLALLLVSSAAAAVDLHPVPDMARVLTPRIQDTRDQVYPSIAYDGKDTLLVVWQQGTSHVGRPGGDILAMRLDRNGKPLDPQPIRVSTAPGSQERPRVTFAGDRFFIVWQDFRSGKNWDVYFARVNPSGKLIDPGGKPLATGDRNQAMPVIAPAGDGALALWLQYADDGFYQIHGALLQGSGKPKHRQALQPPPGTGADWYGYTPGWGYGRSTLSPAAQPDVLRGGNLALTAVNGGWLLSWNDESNWAPGKAGSLSRRVARLVDTGGEIRATAITRVPLFLWPRSTGRFASDGNDALYVGLFHQGRGLGRQYGVTLVFNGNSSQPLPNPNADPQHGVGSGWDASHASLPFGQQLQVSPPLAVAYQNGRYLVVAAGRAALGRTNAHRLYGVRLDRKGKRVASAHGNVRVIYQGTRAPANPALAPSGDGFLLAFEQEDADGVRRIHILTIKGP
ncbi:MAG: hypothetical protein P8173_17880 [Gammaproteobacteria bacterium]